MIPLKSIQSWLEKEKKPGGRGQKHLETESKYSTNLLQKNAEQEMKLKSFKYSYEFKLKLRNITICNQNAYIDAQVYHKEDIRDLGITSPHPKHRICGLTIFTLAIDQPYS